MSKNFIFSAEKRERVGKGAARAVRREGRVPAVVYGGKKEAVAISLDPLELQKRLHQEGFFSSIHDISINGGKKETVIAKDVQFHPVTDRPVHADFLRISQDSQIVVEVPVHFLNEDKAPGIKKGGILNIVRHEIEVACAASDIPEYLEVDLEGGEIGDTFKISSVTLPENVEPSITDRDFVIATIAGQAAEETESDGEDEVIETEVINEKSDEEE
ncbi:MAG: 50S ribosomal protein L25/general stress protein Ctc [Alphaproteobacteria bacterium]